MFITPFTFSDFPFLAPPPCLFQPPRLLERVPPIFEKYFFVHVFLCCHRPIHWSLSQNNKVPTHNWAAQGQYKIQLTDKWKTVFRELDLILRLISMRWTVDVSNLSFQVKKYIKKYKYEGKEIFVKLFCFVGKKNLNWNSTLNQMMDRKI